MRMSLCIWKFGVIFPITRNFISQELQNNNKEKKTNNKPMLDLLIIGQKYKFR